MFLHCSWIVSVKQGVKRFWQFSLGRERRGQVSKGFGQLKGTLVCLGQFGDARDWVGVCSRLGMHILGTGDCRWAAAFVVAMRQSE